MAEEKGMGTTVVCKPTAIQKKALGFLKSGAKHILLFWGSRNGKTTVLVMVIIYRALRFAGSRHLIRIEGFISHRTEGVSLRRGC
jgi:hypothetical protein